MNKLVRDALGPQEHLVVLDDFYTAESLLEAMSRLEFIVGSRYHAIIAAMTSGVPPLILGWSWKYHELMKLFGLLPQVLDYKNMSIEEILAAVDRTWEGREAMRQKILDVLPSLEASANSVMDRTAEILRGIGK